MINQMQYLNENIHKTQQHLNELIGRKNALLNSPTMKAIDQIVNIVKERDVQHIVDLYSNVQFMKQFKTAVVNLGRQSGHTTYITMRAGPDDIVICHHNGMLKYHKHNNTFCKNVFTTANLAFTPWALRGMPVKPRVVYIDCASHLSAQDIDLVYTIASHHASHFVLLG